MAVDLSFRRTCTSCYLPVPPSSSQTPRRAPLLRPWPSPMAANLRHRHGHRHRPRSSHVTPVPSSASQPQVHNARLPNHLRRVTTYSQRREDGRRSERSRRPRLGGKRRSGWTTEPRRRVRCGGKRAVRTMHAWVDRGRTQAKMGLHHSKSATRTMRRTPSSLGRGICRYTPP